MGLRSDQGRKTSAAPARALSSVVLRLDAPFAKLEAGASHLFHDQGVDRRYRWRN